MLILTKLTKLYVRNGGHVATRKKSMYGEINLKVPMNGGIKLEVPMYGGIKLEVPVYGGIKLEVANQYR